MGPTRELKTVLKKKKLGSGAASHLIAAAFRVHQFVIYFQIQG